MWKCKNHFRKGAQGKEERLNHDLNHQMRRKE